MIRGVRVASPVRGDGVELIPVTVAPLGSAKLKDCILADGQLQQAVSLIPESDTVEKASLEM
jgi:hypothetical protein